MMGARIRAPVLGVALALGSAPVEGRRPGNGAGKEKGTGAIAPAKPAQQDNRLEWRGLSSYA
jgi:hypothetical protein